MKKLILPVVAIVALMTMSFTTNTSKFQTVKTENGTYLTNANLLSIDDLQTLEKITVVGKKTTNVFHTKLIKNVLQETVRTHEDTTISSYQEDKLTQILAKY